MSTDPPSREGTHDRRHDDIPITLKAGGEHYIGRIRVIVLRHVWQKKPRFKLLGPARWVQADIPTRKRKRAKP